ncbi:MAG: serine hydroxymethyltransferase [Planctomycetota bacterium]|jgi:glycine hydroxymethyltransferase|nr:serine hydroxymethyltransferase [Planctomycetota bacterium]MDP6369176.1 serine hydroxymethyltransferase [Planctomycetota bacterium]MDP6518976.1 serine hydroxymethyltransferase [Planctomycetota bacterium]MDP6838718.1 serine hydroxymethyltransferase [Planctomycetota bacterium]
MPEVSNEIRSDREVWTAVEAEAARQERQLELIASENHTSREVMAAMGTVLTNKYAEGYPGRRYYGGCEHVDTVEDLARDRAKALFNCSRANVQPHSGTQANMGALMAIAEPGDSVLAMSLDHGGHLSHGHPKNFSGAFYDFHHYGVEQDSERIDMDRVREQALALRPRVLLAGASAYPRTLDFPAFAEIAREADAHLMVDMAHIAGLVAGGVHPSPLPHALVTTLTTHKTLRGPRGGMILADSDIIKKVNSAVFPGGQGGPLMHVIAAKAVALKEAAQPEFASYARSTVENAQALAEALAAGGLRIISGGTDNHLLLVDVDSAGLSGREAEDRLHAVDITCNKNLIPFDQRPPMEASGVRLGTAAITARGLGVAEVTQLGALIVEMLREEQTEARCERVRGAVAELANAFPIYA